MYKLCLLFLLCSCASNKLVIREWSSPSEPSGLGGAGSAQTRITGSAFYQQAISYNWKQRDSLATAVFLQGDVPDFYKGFVRIKSSFTDSLKQDHRIEYEVAPDYLSIGTNEDWARVPLTPMAAQAIADSLHCFLPTRKMVNEIYEQSKVKLAPVPMYAFRDSSVTMWQHHLIIEGQRQGRKGLIAGIKKDVVISNVVSQHSKQNRVAIYGWHLLNGKAIQPLYAGHVNWYVDYSHGIRLIKRTVKVDGKKMDYKDVLRNPLLSGLLTDEAEPIFFSY